MKKILLTFSALAVALCASAGSRLATEEWVKSYVGANAAPSTGAQDLAITYDEAGNTVVSNRTTGACGVIEAETERVLVVGVHTNGFQAAGWETGTIFASTNAAAGLEATYAHGADRIYVTSSNWFCTVSGVAMKSRWIGGRAWMCIDGVVGGVTNMPQYMFYRDYVGPSRAALARRGY